MPEDPDAAVWAVLATLRPADALLVLVCLRWLADHVHTVGVIDSLGWIARDYDY